MTETGRDPRQPLDATAKQQPQQNRFDLIVGVMAGEDIAGTELPTLGFEATVAQAPAGLLQALPRSSAFWDIQFGRGEGNPNLPTQPARGRGPPVGARIEPVIQVERLHVYPKVLAKVCGSPEQGGGVGSAGEGDQQPITCTHGRCGAEEVPQGFENSHDSRRVVAVKGLEPPT